MFTEQLQPQQRGVKRKLALLGEHPATEQDRLRKQLAGRILGQRVQAAAAAAAATAATAANNCNGNQTDFTTTSGDEPKRLLPDPPGPLSYTRFRQIIFNLSMAKLSRYRQTPDPSLLRSVLICNTLKRLEKELEKEGIKISFSPSGVTFVPPTTAPSPAVVMADDDDYIDPGNDVAIESTVNGSSEPTTGDEESENRCLLDLDAVPSGRITPFVRSPLEISSSDLNSSPECPAATVPPPASSLTSSALWNVDVEPSERLSSLNWSSVLTFNSSTTSSALPEPSRGNDSTPVASTQPNDRVAPVTTPSETEPKSGGTSLHTLMPPSATSASSPDTLSCQTLVSHLKGHHRSTNDEIFGDIDLSLYDFDLLDYSLFPVVYG